MKDLGKLTRFLVLEIHKSNKGIFINQHNYIQYLIALAGLQDSKAVDTPLELSVKLRRMKGNSSKIQHLIRDCLSNHYTTGYFLCNQDH